MDTWVQNRPKPNWNAIRSPTAEQIISKPLKHEVSLSPHQIPSYERPIPRVPMYTLPSHDFEPIPLDLSFPRKISVRRQSAEFSLPVSFSSFSISGTPPHPLPSSDIELPPPAFAPRRFKVHLPDMSREYTHEEYIEGLNAMYRQFAWARNAPLPTILTEQEVAFHLRAEELSRRHVLPLDAQPRQLFRSVGVQLGWFHSALTPLPSGRRLTSDRVQVLEEGPLEPDREPPPRIPMNLPYTQRDVSVQDPIGAFNPWHGRGTLRFHRMLEEGAGRPNSSFNRRIVVRYEDDGTVNEIFRVIHGQRPMQLYSLDPLRAWEPYHRPDFTLPMPPKLIGEWSFVQNLHVAWDYCWNRREYLIRELEGPRVYSGAISYDGSDSTTSPDTAPPEQQVDGSSEEPATDPTDERPQGATQPNGGLMYLIRALFSDREPAFNRDELIANAVGDRTPHRASDCDFVNQLVGNATGGLVAHAASVSDFVFPSRDSAFDRETLVRSAFVYGANRLADAPADDVEVPSVSDLMRNATARPANNLSRLTEAVRSSEEVARSLLGIAQGPRVPLRLPSQHVGCGSYTIDGPKKLKNLEVMVNNGFMNSIDDARASATWFSSLGGGLPIEGLYNYLPPHMFMSMFVRFVGRVGIHGTGVQNIRERIQNFRNTHNDEADLILGCHSWGAQDVRDYIETASVDEKNWILDHLYVISLNGVAVVPREMCKNSWNLFSAKDNLSLTLTCGSRYANEREILEPEPDDRGHSFKNPTFNKPLQRIFCEEIKVDIYT